MGRRLVVTSLIITVYVALMLLFAMWTRTMEFTVVVMLTTFVRVKLTMLQTRFFCMNLPAELVKAGITHFSKNPQSGKSKLDWCNWTPVDWVSLAEAQQNWCVPLMESNPMLESLCNAFRNSYIIGIVVLFFCAIDLLLMALSSYMKVHYLKEKKKQLRTTSSMLDFCGGGGLFLLTMVYGFVVYNGFQSGASAGYVVDQVDAIPLAPGFFILAMSAILQITVATIGLFSKFSAEDRLEDGKEFRHMLKDMVVESEAIAKMTAARSAPPSSPAGMQPLAPHTIQATAPPLSALSVMPGISPSGLLTAPGVMMPPAPSVLLPQTAELSGMVAPGCAPPGLIEMVPLQVPAPALPMQTPTGIVMVVPC